MISKQAKQIIHKSKKALTFSNCQADLAQSVERKALNLVVVGSSPTVGDSFSEKELKILLEFIEKFN